MFQCLDFLGCWKWPNILAISVVPVAAYFLSWAPQSAPHPFGTTIFGPERIGPWTVVIGAKDRFDDGLGQELTVNIRFCSGCYEQIRRAALAFGAADGPVAPSKPIVGNPNALQASILVPEIIPLSGLYLWMVAEDWSGKRYSVSWKILPGVAGMENEERGGGTSPLSVTPGEFGGVDRPLVGALTYLSSL